MVDKPEPIDSVSVEIKLRDPVLIRAWEWRQRLDSMYERLPDGVGRWKMHPATWHALARAVQPYELHDSHGNRTLFGWPVTLDASLGLLAITWECPVP